MKFHHLMIAVLMGTTLGCATYEEGSLMHMRHQQEQKLYMGCVHAQLERNMQYVADFGAIANACRDWSRRQLKPKFPKHSGRVDH
ncbi:MAG: hypothetical protein O7G86_20575 [Gammaproteobacteria bacterium]|nr:hypothetical protein [Gammaproteobacteria bacterium]